MTDEVLVPPSRATTRLREDRRAWVPRRTSSEALRLALHSRQLRCLVPCLEGACSCQETRATHRPDSCDHGVLWIRHSRGSSAVESSLARSGDRSQSPLCSRFHRGSAAHNCSASTTEPLSKAAAEKHRCRFAESVATSQRLIRRAARPPQPNRRLSHRRPLRLEVAAACARSRAIAKWRAATTRVFVSSRPFQPALRAGRAPAMTPRTASRRAARCKAIAISRSIARRRRARPKSPSMRSVSNRSSAPATTATIRSAPDATEWLAPCGAVAACTSIGLVERVDDLERGLRDRAHHELRDALAAVHEESLVT